MVNLFEHFDTPTQLLYETLQSDGQKDVTIVMVDDGFLPAEIQTPYRFFADAPTNQNGRPLYFNEVEVPHFWEIEGNNDHAWIKDMGHVRGYIRYRPSMKRRIVSHVEWLDASGKLQYVDHYNQQGLKFAQTVYSQNGQMILRRYFDAAGHEVIYENYISKGMILNWKQKQYHFKTKIDFLLFYIKALDIDLRHFVINSLSTPFTLLYHLGGHGHDILFWQEHSGGHVPGNMQLLLEGKTARTFDVIIPERQEYETITTQLTPEARHKVHQGGYVYPFKKRNQQSRHVLTMTNSDQLPHIETLITALPDVTFHIAAITEMSSRLTRLEQYSNVRLYPAVELEMVYELYQTCDVYLDINEGNEIVDAVNRAFLHDMLILGYQHLAHNHTYTAPSHLYPVDKVESLQHTLQDIYADSKTFEHYLDTQKVHANAIEPEVLKKQLKNVK
ncbi:accessory Sec system glycosylation chaperone GtfB [Staphylococcus canis]|uniref:UDP-N-acetylglucosamine--peptide N-acetylglucosaminyltransferase stabilizing protein GtfB n=1 Tax=Staphylococcus canis TaxID=2724942 RepID=A0ABS0TA25_9STAP|nr:accessory Sec system glycosylation chaperone GtfB [Staphylococcus canis]MBI5975596.1 accessory Sec system glycosylation chaperone GtfB [Staphylococcus canis]